MEKIKHIKLSELAQEVRNAMRVSFPDTYWIIAEVSGHKFYPNNDRHYFELIEKSDSSNEPVAKINGRAWYEGAQSIHQFEELTGQKFTTGLQVLIQVKIEFHPVHGMALILLDIDSSFTLGNLEKQRLEILKRLTDENPDAIRKKGDEYITRNKELQLKNIIQYIAIIGSPNSEGYTDFVHTIDNNQFGYKFNIDIYQSSVQGITAEKELVNKLIDIHTSARPYDCVVLIRGGGAKTDFLVFDTYQLSRAAARFPIPIITGLGHHKDVSIVDMMVHTSVKTPTKAAEFIIAHNRRFEEQVMQIQQSIIIKSQQLLAGYIQEINSTHVFMVHQTQSLVDHYKDQIQDFKQTLTNTTIHILHQHHSELSGYINELKSGSKMVNLHQQSALKKIHDSIRMHSVKYLTIQKTQIDHLQSIVKLMDPKNILKKGFALISKKDRIITTAEDIQARDELTIHMNNYNIQTQVITTLKKDGTETDI